MMTTGSTTPSEAVPAQTVPVGSIVLIGLGVLPYAMVMAGMSDLHDAVDIVQVAHPRHHHGVGEDAENDQDDASNRHGLGRHGFRGCSRTRRHHLRRPRLAGCAGANRRPDEALAGRPNYRRSAMRVASILGFWLGRGLLSLLPVMAGVPAAAESVPAYHGHANRSGNFTTPELTWEHARALRFDAGFMPHFEGHLYAQPLYWRTPGAAADVLIVGSESNVVTAIDAASGNTVWTRALGRPAPLSAFGWQHRSAGHHRHPGHRRG